MLNDANALKAGLRIKQCVKIIHN